MSSTLSSQSGRVDLPKPGCDGATKRRFSDSGATNGCCWTETAAAMQEQNGTRPLTGIEQFKLDVCDFQHCRLHANASRGDARCEVHMTVGIALCRKRCISTSRKECRRGNSCIAPAPYTLK